MLTNNFSIKILMHGQSILAEKCAFTVGDGGLIRLDGYFLTPFMAKVTEMVHLVPTEGQEQVLLCMSAWG